MYGTVLVLTVQGSWGGSERKMKGGGGEREEEGKGSFESCFSFSFFLWKWYCGLGFVGYGTRSLRSVTRRARGWKESRDPSTRRKDHSAVYAQLSESLCWLFAHLNNWTLRRLRRGIKPYCAVTYFQTYKHNQAKPAVPHPLDELINWLIGLIRQTNRTHDVEKKKKKAHNIQKNNKQHNRITKHNTAGGGWMDGKFGGEWQTYVPRSDEKIFQNEITDKKAGRSQGYGKTARKWKGNWTSRRRCKVNKKEKEVERGEREY